MVMVMDSIFNNWFLGGNSFSFRPSLDRVPMAHPLLDLELRDIGTHIKQDQRPV